ncbi:preprotein translocase subunit SecY [Candidatus Pacearchaeota archaeon CG10_big_fil_rev_8_21_14_0_10_35_13]|nr:MAG: preprotein translocase subunit SecY [Candidatus Pacearchaeota archaeon CG10_big_fil_rev_8_21_14_0_10_35_13]
MELLNILKNLPEVKGPVEKKLSFNVKLKWTMIVLLAFFVLANIPLYGLAKNALDRFQYLAIILGTDFGSIISLGIGPIVMASIILQLLVGSKILNIDTSTKEGKRYFQGLQKLLVFFFIIFEAVIYVVMNGLQALPGYTAIVIFQLVLGGVAILFMDELMQKWGFGSGISLFIVAGVGWRLFTGMFQFIGAQGGNCLLNFSQTACAGKVLIVIQAVIQGAPTEALKALAVILATAVIFLLVVWAQSLRVEVPLSYDKLRGYGVKWPLTFFYASVIPVILVAALAANLQLFAGLLENSLGHATFLGTFSQGTPVGGLAYWLHQSNIVELIITGSLTGRHLLQALTHILFYVVFSTVFAMFWVKTSGMDAESQAKNIMNSGLQIPGFRKDERVLESVLKRYVGPLTIMGGAAIGLLASVANLLGALTSGTAILLAVMIIYQFYQNIAQQHAVDMHPALKKLSG